MSHLAKLAALTDDLVEAVTSTSAKARTPRSLLFIHGNAHTNTD
jgi:hypothetical protein